MAPSTKNMKIDFEATATYNFFFYARKFEMHMCEIHAALSTIFERTPRIFRNSIRLSVWFS